MFIVQATGVETKSKIYISFTSKDRGVYSQKQDNPIEYIITDEGPPML